MRDDNSALRGHLVELLHGSNAHSDFEATIASFPAELRGVKPSGLPHTAWHLLSSDIIVKLSLVPDTIASAPDLQHCSH